MPRIGVGYGGLSWKKVRAIVDGADLTTPTPAAGWDVRDSISHLAGTDVEATLSMRDQWAPQSVVFQAYGLKSSS